MKRLIVAVAVSGALICACGASVTGVWTGAEDGYWTNANNWANGAMPGRVLGLDGGGNVVTNGVKGDTARFNGSETGAKITEINLDGLVGIRLIEVSGGASTPVYTFGADGEQVIPLEQMSSSTRGTFSVLGTDTPAPILRGIVSIGIEYDAQTWFGGYGSIVKNESSNTLVLNDYGAMTRSAGSVDWTYGLELSGRGPIRIDGDRVRYATTKAFFLTLDNAKTIINTDLNKNGLFAQLAISFIYNTTTYGYSKKEIEITKNGKLEFCNGYYYAGITSSAALDIYGEGPIVVTASKVGQAGIFLNTCQPGGISLSYHDAKISAPIYVKDIKCNPPHNHGIVLGNLIQQAKLSASATGFLTLTGENWSTGMVRIANNGGGLVVDSIGRKTERGRLGVGGTVCIANGCKLRYTGAGETFDRTLLLSKTYTDTPDIAEGCLEASGIGTLFSESIVSQDQAQAILHLGGTGEGVFSTPIAENPDASVSGDATLSLVKDGTGTWTLNATNTYSGTTTMTGGVLRIGAAGSFNNTSGLVAYMGRIVFEDADQPVTNTLAGISLTGSDAVSLVLGRNRTLVLATEPTRTGSATLKISATAFGAGVVVDGKTSADALPAFITVNGTAATYSDDGGVVVDGATARWAAAADGQWGTAAGWADGVMPSAATAVEIMADGADYTVSLSGAGACASLLARNLSGVATLDVAGSLAMDSGYATFGAGAKVSVPAGGRFTADGAAASADALSESFTLEEGARFSVDGGTAVITNFAGNLCVRSSDAANPSVLEVKDGGTFTYDGLADKGDMVIGAGGRLEVTNATLLLSSNATGGDLLLDGGEAVFAGTSKVASAVTAYGVTRRFFGAGNALFKDDAVLEMCAKKQAGAPLITPARVGETATVTFADSSYITNSFEGTGQITVGNTLGGRAVLNIDTDRDCGTTGTCLSFRMCVGADFGVGELNKRGSGDFCISANGWHIGTTTVGTMRDDLAATGIVRVANGKLFSGGSGALMNGWDFGHPSGILVGYGCAPAVSGRPIYGRIELSGGTIQSYQGHVLVGVGAACGDVVVTNGTFNLNDNRTSQTVTLSSTGNPLSVYASNTAAVVGMAGGIGRFTLSNGTVRAGSPIFVGGASTNVFFLEPCVVGNTQNYTAKKLTGFPFDRHDAEGTLTIAGGTFRVNNNVVLGADGSGTLEIVGSTASVTAKSLILSNATESVVRFVPDATGVSTVHITDRLQIGAGSRLEIDMSGCARHRLRLFEYGTLEGSFDAGDVVVTGQAKPQPCQLLMDDGSLSFVVSSGTTVIIR